MQRQLDNAPHTNKGATPDCEEEGGEHYDTKTKPDRDEEDGYVQKIALHNEASQLEQQKTQEGEAHFHRLGWKRLTVILVVEAIALGSLSLPSAFATLGMVAGIFCCVGLGLIAVYTSHIIGQVKLKFPHVSHYGAAIGLLFGKFGEEFGSAMVVLQLILLIGSHCLTGTIAFVHITESGVCSVIFGLVSSAILLLLAIPPSFTDIAILGYIDFASIIIAIGMTIIATGISTGDTGAGGNWSAWPREDATLVDAVIAITNILFAYSFAMCQFNFMDEMHTTRDYVKSIWALGIIEIFIYTITGAVIYAFVGRDVQSPALLSAGKTISKIAFGIALPVIFISGSINIVVLGRYLHHRLFKNSITRYINTTMGWVTWVAVLLVITILSFISSEAIPIFTDILSVCSSLFVSGFTLYLPAVMWFKLIKEGRWYSKGNLPNALMSLFCFVLGIVFLTCGTTATIIDIVSTECVFSLGMLANSLY